MLSTPKASKTAVKGDDAAESGQGKTAAERGKGIFKVGLYALLTWEHGKTAAESGKGIYKVGLYALLMWE